MNIPVILYGDDGTLLAAIESQRGAVSVARTVQDFSEALGMAQTGIARVLLCAHVPADLSASLIDSLSQMEVLLAVIAPESLSLPARAHRIRPEASREEILGSIERAVDANLARPHPEYGHQALNREHHISRSTNTESNILKSSGYGYDSTNQGEEYGSSQVQPSTSSASQYGYDPGPDPAGAPDAGIYNIAASYEPTQYGYNPGAAEHTASPSDAQTRRGEETPEDSESSAVQIRQESVLEQAATIVDSYAPGSEYALHPKNKGEEEQLPEYPDDTWNPQAPPRYQPGYCLGKMVTVWGTHGAPGRSTIAFNLAAFAAQEGQQVCLIDADTYAPSLDALMALEDTGSGLSILCSDADRAQLDEKKAGAVIERVPLKRGAFDFLSGITSASRWPEIRARAFSEVLEWLRHRYELIICDIAAPIEMDEELTFDGPVPRRNAASLTAIAEADRLIVLGEADVVGLPRLINLAREVQSRPDIVAPDADVQYWLNRARREAAGFNVEAKMRDNWVRYLSVPLAGVIPYERKLMDRLRRNGEAAIEVTSRGAILQVLEQMLEGLQDIEVGR